MFDNFIELDRKNVSVSDRFFKTPAIWIVLLFIVAGTFMSALIPPFQSPDEFEHVKRAYFLSHGTILLESPAGQSSGDYMDTGLREYMDVYLKYIGSRENRISIDASEEARFIRWSGKKDFMPASGAATYFPLAYAPQAIGLGLGEKMGWTVDISYRLARFLALVSVACLLVLSFRLFPVSPLVVALIILPMSFFQFSSASLDSCSNALGVFCIAAFLRLSVDKEKSAAWIFYAFAFCMAILITSRVYLLPFLLLLLAACFYVNIKARWVVFCVTVLFVFGWFILAMKTTVDNRVHLGVSTGAIVGYYVKNPWRYFQVLIATLSFPELFRFYRDSFIGVLGWLDVPFRDSMYSFLGWLLSAIALLSISLRNFISNLKPRILLLVCAFLSALMIFFALLVSWNPHPAVIIEGIQGRYFWIPVVMLAYALSGELSIYEGWNRKVALALLVILCLVSISETTRNVINRYYTTVQEVEMKLLEIRPSPALSADQSILIEFDEKQKNNPQLLSRIGVMFGTYARLNPGSANLVLKSQDGRVLTLPFRLNALRDNQYYFFTLDARPYQSAKIISHGGIGVSTWENFENDGYIKTCVVYEFANGVTRYTKGCPRS